MLMFSNNKTCLRPPSEFPRNDKNHCFTSPSSKKCAEMHVPVNHPFVMLVKLPAVTPEPGAPSTFSVMSPSRLKDDPTNHQF